MFRNYAIAFWLFNLLDAAVTNIVIVRHGEIAEENNPLVNTIIDFCGWFGFWVFKILGPIVAALIVYFAFNNKKEKIKFGINSKFLSLQFAFKKAQKERIMLGCCIGFLFTLIYSYLTIARGIYAT